MSAKVLDMSIKLDLKAIAKRAVKKTTGQYTSLKVLELFPAKNKTQKSSLEEGTLKVQFPDLGIELRNIIYKIRPEKVVTIILPYKIYPKEGQKLKKGQKPKFVSIDILSFMDEEVWENVREEIKRQALELFEKSQL